MLTQEKELKEKQELDKQIKEYLKRGGEITVCPKYQRSEKVEYVGGFWGRRKKAKKEN